jgi:hypothetical protein
LQKCAHTFLLFGWGCTKFGSNPFHHFVIFATFFLGWLLQGDFAAFNGLTRFNQLGF